MIFNANEVFEIARQIEVNGAAFYHKAADIAEGAEAKKFLLDLAAMEEEHDDFFGDLQRKLTAAPGGCESVPDFDQQSAAYLRSMADGKVFDADSDPGSKLRGDETIEELLRLAISFEKNSVVFFLTVKEMVPASLGKEKVNYLIREELKHIAMLSEELLRQQSS